MKNLYLFFYFFAFIPYILNAQTCTEGPKNVSEVIINEGDSLVSNWHIGRRYTTQYCGCSICGYLMEGIVSNISISGPAILDCDSRYGTCRYVLKSAGIVTLKVKTEYISISPTDCSPPTNNYSCGIYTEEIHVTVNPKPGPPNPPDPPTDPPKQPLVQHFHKLSNSSKRTLLRQDSLFRVSADGVESSIFKFSGGDINYYNTFIELWGNPDNSSTESKYYGLYDIISQSADSLVISYKHPTHIPGGANNGNAGFLIKTSKGNKSYSINVSHPPVLLVNGLFTQGTSFNNFETAIIQTGLYRNTRYVKTLQYSNNALNVPFMNSVHFIPESIDSLINDVVTLEKTATGAVDIVAHADGGIVSRLYMQGNNYRGDVHKFITVNTPHAGTQLANFWMQPIRQDYQCWAFSKWCNKGAITNLEVDSPFMKGVLNGNGRTNLNVASHSIATKVSEAYRNISEPPSVEEWIECGKDAAKVGIVLGPIAGGVECIESFLTSRVKGAVLGAVLDISGAEILGGYHDYVSSVESQKGGLPESSTTIIENQYCENSLENIHIVNKIKELIQTDPLGNKFSRNGFNPPVLTYSTNSSVNSSIASVGNNPTIKINKPLTLSKYYKGTLLDIDISSSNLVKTYIMISHTNELVYALQSTKDSTKFKFSTDSLLGKRTLYAIGKTANGNLVRDSVSFYITDNLCDHVHVNSYMYITGKPASGTYTFNNIASDAIIEPGRTVNFQTIGNVVFLKDFQAKKQSVFSTSQIGCPPATNSSELTPK